MSAYVMNELVERKKKIPYLMKIYEICEIFTWDECMDDKKKSVKALWAVSMITKYILA